MKLKSTLFFIIFVLATFLMTGIYQDDEFAECHSFVKYTPDLQFYYLSPFGMEDVPKNFPPDLSAKQEKCQDFIRTKHWSGGLQNVAFAILVFFFFPQEIINTARRKIEGIFIFKLFLKIIDTGNFNG